MFCKMLIIMKLAFPPYLVLARPTL